MSVSSAPLRVVVRCGCLDGRLRVEVRSTGGASAATIACGDGLEYLRRRLDLLYRKDGYDWTLSESARGVSLTVAIPLET